MRFYIAIYECQIESYILIHILFASVTVIRFIISSSRIVTRHVSVRPSLERRECLRCAVTIQARIPF
jgi:hypothetical protein